MVYIDSIVYLCYYIFTFLFRMTYRGVVNLNTHSTLKYMKLRIGLTATLAVLTWSFVYLCLPTLAVDFLGALTLVIAFAVITLLIWTYTDDNRYGTPPFKGGKKTLRLTLGSAGAILLIGWMSCWPMFRAKDYHKLITVTSKDFDPATFSIVEPSHARTVSHDLALKFANMILGEVPSLSSRCTIKEMTEQKVGDKILWVGVLEHNGFMAWWENDTTPGYVTVSSTDESDRHLVRNLAGKDLQIAYAKECFLSYDIKRRAYFAHPTIGQTDCSFEIDDAGKPYWVMSLYEHRIGVSGDFVTGVMLIDAQTGETSEYSLGDMPIWVDRIQPSSMVVEQLEDYGEYVGGWLNSWGGNNVIHPSKEPALVYGQDGDTYWYVDARGKDEKSKAAIGHFLVNSRTGQVTRYDIPGVVHEAASESIKGSVQKDRYSCGRLLPYSAHGQLVYMGTLFDDSGNRKGIGLALYSDSGVVGTGNTVDDAMRSLRRAMGNRGRTLAPSDRDPDLMNRDGIVRSVTFNGDTAYILFEEKGDITHGYVVPRDISPEVMFTSPGSNIAIRFQKTTEPLIDVVWFDNVDLNFGRSSGSGTGVKTIAAERQP